jgi:hypothetical protein
MFVVWLSICGYIIDIVPFADGDVFISSYNASRVIGYPHVLLRVL